MQLVNKKSGAVLELPYDLYPIDDLNWSSVVSKTEYLLNGALDVQQGVRQAGKPLTLQSNDDLGLVTRETVNQLHDWCAIPEAVYDMVYMADGATKRVSVMFDTTKTPIEATPAKGFNSPDLADYFEVTVRFLVV